VDKWEKVTHKKIPTQETRDRSNWLYIYNQVNQRTHTKRFVGNVEEWKELLSKQLTDDFALLTGCIRVTAPKFDHRMVIECASKSARRLLYAALRKKRGPLKCSISLSATEYTNRAEVYRQARRWKLNVEDKGDMMIVKHPQAPGHMTDNKIWLDRPTAQIEHAIRKIRGSHPP
jgi:hypothetical protein